MTPEREPSQRIVVVAGMPRAATTFLYHTLAKHPQAWVPARKEIEYFSLNHYRGTDWYRSFFEGAAEHQVGFDISPIYFMVPEVPERIRKFDPSAKIVLLVRDPVEFVLSFYANRRGATHEDIGFEAFLSGHTYSKDGRTVELVFDDGRIRSAIEGFRSAFGANLLLCSYESLRHDPLPVLMAIEAFAGMQSYFTSGNFENVRVNAGDQRNIVWLNWMMHQKWFADAVVRLVPRSLILRARYWVQTRRKGGSEASSVPEWEGDRSLAEARLVGDRRYVQELFRGAGLLLGSGEPFPAAAHGTGAG